MRTAFPKFVFWGHEETSYPVAVQILLCQVIDHTLVILGLALLSDSTIRELKGIERRYKGWCLPPVFALATSCAANTNNRPLQD